MSNETPNTPEVETDIMPSQNLTRDDVTSMLGDRDIQIQLLSVALARAQQRNRELERQLKSALTGKPTLAAVPLPDGS